MKLGILTWVVSSEQHRGIFVFGTLALASCFNQVAAWFSLTWFQLICSKSSVNVNIGLVRQT